MGNEGWSLLKNNKRNKIIGYLSEMYSYCAAFVVYYITRKIIHISNFILFPLSMLPLLKKLFFCPITFS